MVEDGTGQTIVFSEDHGVVQRVCRRQRGTRSFELLSDVHDDKGLILNEGLIARREKGVALLIDIPQLIIQLNEPLRDCPALLSWILAYVKPIPLEPFLQASGDGRAKSWP